MSTMFKSVLDRPFVRIVFAIAVAVSALLLRHLLVRELARQLPAFILLYSVVVFTAIMAGLWAGLLVTVIGVLYTSFFILPPIGHFEIARPTDVVALFLFATMGLFISVLAERYRRSERQRQVDGAAPWSQGEMMQFSFDAITIVRLDGGIEFWNRGAERLYGYSKTEALDRNPHLLLKTSPALPWEEIVAMLRNRETLESELHQVAKDGRKVVVSTRYQIVVGTDGAERILKISRDITSRRLAEERVRQLNRVYAVLSDVNQTIVREKDSAALLRAACNIAVEKGEFPMAWIGMISPGTGVLRLTASRGPAEDYLNGAAIDPLDPAYENLPAAQCVRSGLRAICNDIEHSPAVISLRDKALRSGFRSSASFPLKVDGEVAGVLTLYSGEPGFFEDEEIKLLDEMAMDIGYALAVNRRDAERRRAEEELRWRTAFFEAQVESSPDGVLVVDSEGKKILQNRRTVELLKIPPHVADDPDDAPQRHYVAQLMTDPEAFVSKVNDLTSHPEEIDRREIKLLDGTILDRYSSPVRDRSGHYYGRIWTFRDITEVRRLEEQFSHAQKMEAIGRLTGGIAHDFNNLLTVILGCSEVMAEEVKDNPRFGQMNGMILESARRGAELTHRMLAFARRQTLQPRPVSICRLVLNMESLLRRTLSAAVILDLSRDAENCVSIVDPAQLESALLNLCINAQDAMPRGGKITIEVRKVTLDEEYAVQHIEVNPGDYVLIDVTDTGSGISPENLHRVFEPFFTTKEIGKGTGLGLSMVYGFIKQSQGHVAVYSEVGHGTSVKLYLPHASQPEASIDDDLRPTPTAGGSELILLVEDNETVREFARLQLSRLGYRVLVAANGREALSIASERSDIDLMFTDMVMPGDLTGGELARQIGQLNPKIKVLYCSGYAEAALHHEGLLDEKAKLLNKPYTHQELAAALREALTER